MIFNLKTKRDQKLETFYEDSMKELGEFFEINWNRNRPNVWLVPDRKTIDDLRGEKTPGWVVGWGGAQYGGVYILDSKNFEKESDNKYSPERWNALIKHELVHCFYDIITGYQRKPRWLGEGVAVYLSGQNQWHKPVNNFKTFLDSYDHVDKSVYSESGFVIELLIEKFGREKLLELLRKIKEEKPDEKGFKEMFESNYGIELKYEKLNALLKN